MLFSLVKKIFQNFHSLYEKQEICKNSSAKSVYNTGEEKQYLLFLYSYKEILLFFPVLKYLFPCALLCRTGEEKQYLEICIYFMYFFFYSMLNFIKYMKPSRYAMLTFLLSVISK